MDIDLPYTCVKPDGSFLCLLHSPSFTVKNLRKNKILMRIGSLAEGGVEVDNSVNFPSDDLEIIGAEEVYEVPNPFPFWGATYILKPQADNRTLTMESFRFRHGVGQKEDRSRILADLLKGRLKDKNGRPYRLSDLPRTILLALAQTSKDADVLKAIAEISCDMEFDSNKEPCGLCYLEDANGNQRPLIKDYELFDVVANNEALPNDYKKAMVLNPGVQGPNPIVGEYGPEGETHVWEYMRANSYIPWGHYASNMAHDSIRYSIERLKHEDIIGLRALYYQRIYVQLAVSLGIPLSGYKDLSFETLEGLRSMLYSAVKKMMMTGKDIPFNATLWGWNYGFDFSPSGYRLHASHQQIHQQFALIPKDAVATCGEGRFPTYTIGDQAARFAAHYRRYYNISFFDAYINAIYSNKRLDFRDDLPKSLVIYEDEHVIVHTPKAQRSQGEVQIMTKVRAGNILEADAGTRKSLDAAIYLVMKGLHRLGAEMITCYEVSKRFDNPDPDQRLFYCFLPRHPQSPGAFSERQGRWVTGHYPEDFAEVFRQTVKDLA
ncbi:hypothetical protein [Dissulfurimicrobium hydrothermale]|uniref:hypothetical protein n=1 Tax=Dissulfurimicrobium hydrothermale TaxID=1750598 RepID=UPI001EDC0D4B|nr:hypothetical protein [Dissulfurimicrobium hydrothermale]UKL13256.1 hypothetical protein LGS26_07145 [Dissulfurimicrobium hydrothermale]